MAENASPQGLSDIFDRCGISLTQTQTNQFWIYHGLLRHHNTLLNLTRIHNFSNMVLKLYVDSVLPEQMINLPSPLMDLGTGPGMPGIPLKILRPDVEIWLAEGRAKRVEFLHTVIAELNLDGIQVVGRNITPDFEQPMNSVITRAVEVIPQTLARVKGCLNQKGRIIFMKGPGCDAEIEAARQHFGETFALVADRHYRIGQTRHERRLVTFERLDRPTYSIKADVAQRYKILDITSEQNPRFKQMKKLLTGRGLKKSGQAIMSGQRPVAEMLRLFPERCMAWITNGDKPLIPPDAPPEMQWLQLSDPLYQALDLFGTRGPMLNIHVPSIDPWAPEEGFPEGCSLLVPFQDPENIGAVIRSAAAFGVTQVILLSESAHPYHPKALRASGGMTPMMKLRRGPALNALPRELPILALSAEGQNVGEVEFPKAFGMLVGLEGGGVPALWRNNAVSIPIDADVESLNASVSAAIALYEWRKRSAL